MIERSEYEDAINWLYDLQFFGMKLGLSNTLALLEGIGNPHEKFSSIHVAGSNGKGSVCAFLTSILKESGKKVGTYTSPHLTHFGERITINGIPMTRTEVVKSIQHIRPKVEELRKKDIQCTFFEATTCMAFYHFARRRIDIAIVEVGMGGRLDSTNVIKPEMAVITSISKEHSQHLGETIKEIAGEKAGIIKKKIPTITSTQGEALSVIQAQCKKMKSKLYNVNDIALIISNASIFGTSMKIDGLEVSIKLPGQHQAINAKTAVLAAKTIGIKPEAIEKGLAATEWPGRIQIVRKSPMIILDSTHNPGGAEALASFLRGQKIKPILVLGMLEDKEVQPVVKALEPLASKIIVTQPEYHRKMIAKELASHFSGKIETVSKLPKAIEKAMKIAKKNDIILITGSIFTASETLEHLNLMRINEIMDKLAEIYGIGAYPGRDPVINGPPPPGSQEPFRVLISTILSQRTKDENTHLATEQLFAKYDTPKKLASAKPEDIYDLIRPAGFYKQKAEKVIQTSKIIQENYKSKVPDNM
ncbi:MAG: hypothetical protein KAJ33_03185, partial [Thermoplasmata archaeon]|nr:hypothetical protein [Thermoplasmata archaeon]